MSTPSGKFNLTIGSFAVLLLSVFEILKATQLMALTNGLYKSSFFCGIFCLIAGCGSLFIMYTQNYYFSLNCIAVLNFCSAVPCAIAMGSLAAYWYYFPSFESCGSFEASDYSCGKYLDDYSCFGNSNTFPLTYSCVSQLHDRESKCACVSSSGDCYVYENIPSCADYYSSFHEELTFAFVLCVFLFVICCWIMLQAMRGMKQQSPQSPGISMRDRKIYSTTNYAPVSRFSPVNTIVSPNSKIEKVEESVDSVLFDPADESEGLLNTSKIDANDKVDDDDECIL